MSTDLIITREIAPIPTRPDDAHKGDVGRVVIIGGCDGDIVMAGAPALSANAAFRAGAGLIQLIVPESLRAPCIVMSPACTARTLPRDAGDLVNAVREYEADVVALGPGLGRSLTAGQVHEFLVEFAGPVIIDADALNRISELDSFDVPNPGRMVFTPHPGEAHRLLAARKHAIALDPSPASRREAALALHKLYGGIIVLKGRGTVVTDGRRLYVNETGNAGLATAGTGDVLTGVIAALIGQKMNPFEAAILGVYLHGLAGDFAAEELGRLSMTAADVIVHLPMAISEHQTGAET